MITPFIRQESPQKILLCRQGSCCPAIEQNADGFTISDDFGGKVQLSPEEFGLLSKAVEHFTPTV